MSPTETLLLFEYIMNGMLGGIITPRPPATATSAAQKLSS